jgi:hypothetical protein
MKRCHRGFVLVRDAEPAWGATQVGLFRCGFGQRDCNRALVLPQILHLANLCGILV